MDKNGDCNKLMVAIWEGVGQLGEKGKGIKK